MAASHKHCIQHLIDTQGRRLLGMTLDGKPLWAPKGHSILLSGNGGGKTTCGCMIWIGSLIASENRPSILVMDVKDGELASQWVPMLQAMNIPVAVIDDMNVLGEDFPCKISLNSMGSVAEAFTQSPMDVNFATDTANHALIADPVGGPDKNKFFLDGPRALLEFCYHSIFTRSPHIAGPGAVWALLSNPKLLKEAAELEAQAGDGMAKILAMNVLDVMETEYYPMHREAAMVALRIYGLSSPLHHAGVNADTTHAELIKNRTVTFLVGPQRYMSRLSSYFSLHLSSFLSALYSGAGRLTFINDEFTNAPLKSFVDALTTIRGYGGEAHCVAQSRSEIEKKFGKLETLPIEENAIVKQWFGFSSFDEAERVSKAMGDALAFQHSLNVDHKRLSQMGSALSLTKQRQLTASELMAMKPHQQLLWVKGVGFILAEKLVQNQQAPFCYHYAPNRIEGGVLPADPRITYKLPAEYETLGGQP